MTTFVTLLVALLVVYPFWRIFARAGFPGWLAVGMVLPVVNLALLYFLAFAQWPALRGVARIERVGDPRR